MLLPEFVDEARLIGQMKLGDRALRSAAIAELGRMNAELLADLEIPSLREHALRVLVEVGLANQIPIEILAEITQSGSLAAQRRAYRVLSRKDLYPPEVRAKLSRLAADPNAPGALHALVVAVPRPLAPRNSLEPVQAEPAAQLKDLLADAATRELASRVARQLQAQESADAAALATAEGVPRLPFPAPRTEKSRSQTISDLLWSIRNRDPDTRVACNELGARAWQPGRSTPKASIVDVLTTAARDEDEGTRYHAVLALGKIGSAFRAASRGPIDSRVVQALLAALADESGWVRHAALLGFENYTRDSEALDVALLGCLRDPATRDGAVRIIANRLANRGTQPDIPLDQLYKTLVDGNTATRDAALPILLGQAVSDEQLERLIAAMEKPESRRRVFELLSVGDAAAISRLAELAADTKLSTHREAARLFELVVNEKESIPGLIKTLDSANPEARELAAEALGNFGPAAKSAVPALARHLADESGIVRLVSAYALEKIGPEARDALPALHKAVAGEDLALRSAAAHALPKIALAGGNK